MGAICGDSSRVPRSFRCNPAITIRRRRSIAIAAVGRETVRVLMDCLIGALAIRADLPVLHADADFDALARHTPLRVDTA